MDMQVEDDLTAGLAIVLTHGEPIGLQPAADATRHLRAGAADRRRGIRVSRPQIGDVGSRDDKRVPPRRRPGVEHRDAVLVLGDDMGGGSAGNDPAERAILVNDHSALMP